MRTATLALIGAAVVVLCWTGAGMRLSPLAERANLRAVATIAAGFWPPELSPAFLARVGRAVLQTFGIAVAGGALGCAAGTGLAALGRRKGVGLVALGAARILASVPEVVWALLFVVGLGPGPLPGAIGLALGSLGWMANAPEGWREAALARFPAFVRSAAVVGFVGAGGIGRDLDLWLRWQEPAKVATVVAALAALVLAAEAGAAVLARNLRRARPGLVRLALVAVLAVAFQQAGLMGLLAPDLLPRLGRFAVQLVPPDVSGPFLVALAEPVWHTVAISVVGTALGIVLGKALARARPVRAVLRAIPALVWVPFCVLAAGHVPFAGALALGLHGAGTPLRDLSLRSALARWRDNLAVATVVGVAGGGGLGAQLATDVRLAFYDRTATAVLVILGLVSSADELLDAVRREPSENRTVVAVPDVENAPEK